MEYLWDNTDRQNPRYSDRYNSVDHNSHTDCPGFETKPPLAAEVAIYEDPHYKKIFQCFMGHKKEICIYLYIYGTSYIYIYMSVYIYISVLVS
jgi:hypothetical protein